MMTKREQYRIAVQKKRWDEEMRPIDKWLKWVWREIKIYFKMIINWYLFYKPKDTTEKIWHLIMVALVDILLLRLFGLI
jgi:uncharacterized membrane protein YkvA (DUF1232 family)